MAQVSLYDALRLTAEGRSEEPAVTFLDAQLRAKTYTYRSLFSAAQALGNALAATYDDRRSPLGILVETHEAQVLHYLAGLHARVVPALLTPPNRKLNQAYYVETMAAVLRNCRFGALVNGVPGIESQSRSLRPFSFEDLDPGSEMGDKRALKDGELDASFMQFSSGTTGIKKGVLVSDEAVLSQTSTYGAALGLTPADTIVSWLPLYHDMGFIACLNMPLLMGAHIVMIEPIDWVSDPALYLRAVSEYGGTLSWHPNFAFSFMAQRTRDGDLDELDLTSIRALVNCSEPVTHESQQMFMDRFKPVGLGEGVFTGCYAMAETTFALTHGTSSDPGYIDTRGPSGSDERLPKTFVSVGRPLAGVTMSIRDPETHRELSVREIGEIWVKSPFNLTGYFNDRESTRSALVDGWYRTGDLGYIAPDGSYFVVGRLKDLLIVGGVNVFPSDIEDLVSAVDGVMPGRATAFALFDPRMQSERVCVLAESEATSEESMQLRIEIRQRIIAALQVTNLEVHVVEPGWLIKSTSGKIARGKNREKWLDQARRADRPREATTQG